MSVVPLFPIITFCVSGTIPELGSEYSDMQTFYAEEDYRSGMIHIIHEQTLRELWIPRSVFYRPEIQERLERLDPR